MIYETDERLGCPITSFKLGIDVDEEPQYIYIYLYIYVYVADVVSILPRECSTQWCGAVLTTFIYIYIYIYIYIINA